MWIVEPGSSSDDAAELAPQVRGLATSVRLGSRDGTRIYNLPVNPGRVTDCI
jgi:hypothetical protein